jgi:hypothetical protein
VAIWANPVKLGPAEAAQDVAASVLAATPDPVAGRNRAAAGSPRRQSNSGVQAGLVLTAVLLGIALARRRRAIHRTAG